MKKYLFYNEIKFKFKAKGTNVGIIIDKKIKEKLQETYLWRYISLPKFLDLITTQEIYFATNSQLITGDPYEGALPFFTDFLFNFDNEHETFINNLVNDSKELQPFLEKIQTKGLSLKVNNIRDNTFINCWHINDDENYLMWQSYAPESGAVAIVTDICSLIEAIDTDIEINAIPIIYNSKDFNQTVPDRKSEDEQELKNLVKLSSLYKKEFFKGENELRLIYQFGNTNRIKVKLDKLIKHIYLSPESTETERQIIINSLNLLKDNGKFNIESIEKIVSNSFISHTYKKSANEIKKIMRILASNIDIIQATEDEKKQIPYMFLLTLLLTDIPCHRMEKEMKKAENNNLSSDEKSTSDVDNDSLVK